MPAGEWLRSFFPPDPRAQGREPDYRFTLANERTFLAWIRTALAMAAGGLGAVHLLPDLLGRHMIGVLLLGLSLVTAAASYRRWARAELAMRLGEPLPASRLPVVMAVGTAVLSLLVTALLVADAW